MNKIDWVDLRDETFSFKFDIRYATSENFLNRTFYETPDAFLHRPVFEDLHSAHLELNQLGYGILVFDAYRPFFVTEMFWNLATELQKNFLADPKKGSNHNRGCAIDCSLFDLKSGNPIEMPSDFDEMNEKAWIDYQGGSEASRKSRDLLIDVMKKYQFMVAPNEWWHFNHPLKSSVEISNLSFTEIKKILSC